MEGGELEHLDNPRRKPIKSCDHSKLTRICDDYGSQRCSICDQTPEFGFLFGCVDCTEHGVLAEPEFANLQDEMRKFNIGGGSMKNISRNHFSHPAPFTNDVTVTNNAGGQTRAPVSSVRLARDEVETGSPAQALLSSNRPRHHRTNDFGCDFKVCSACRPICRDQGPQPGMDNDTLLSSEVGQQRTHPGVIFHGLANMSYYNFLRSRGSRFYEHFPEHVIQDARSSSTSASSQDDFAGQVKKQPSTFLPKQMHTFDGASTYESSEQLVVKNPCVLRERSLTVRPHDPQTAAPGNENPHSDSATLSPSACPSASSPPFFLRRDSLEMFRSSCIIGNESDNSSTAGGSGDYVNESVIKAMQEREKEQAAAIDVDEDSKEKRAGRRLSKGRFFID